MRRSSPSCTGRVGGARTSARRPCWICSPARPVWTRSRVASGCVPRRSRAGGPTRRWRASVKRCARARASRPGSSRSSGIWRAWKSPSRTLAIEHELVERVLKARPSRPGRSRRWASPRPGVMRRWGSCARPSGPRGRRTTRHARHRNAGLRSAAGLSGGDRGCRTRRGSRRSRRSWPSSRPGVCARCGRS